MLAITCRTNHEGGRMPLTELNHYFVRANDLEQTKAFYMEVLGMEVMPRPNFPFPGYWLGANGKIQVHMGPHGIPNSALYYIGTPEDAATDQSGVVDHIAFLATEPKGFVERLQSRGIAFRPRYLREFQLYQLFLKDPNGLTIELNFFGIQDDPGWGGEDYAKMPRVETVD
jgi:catechol 2,3-dioxygenase-like lactoylglutathione lyase family enzyme